MLASEISIIGILVDPSRQPEGIEDWFQSNYPDVNLIGSSVPIEPHAPSGNTLIGVHGSADGNWGQPMSVFKDLDIAKSAKVEAWKFLSNENAESVDELRDYKEDIFIMVRLFAHQTDLGLGAFLDRVSPQIKEFYNKGVRHFEVHNEPNLHIEGMWQNWQNGKEFSDWFLAICRNLRNEYEGILLGYAGLSPGHAIPNVRYDPIAFHKEADAAVREADWIGAHCYWQSRSEMLGQNGGLSFQRLETYGKPILITEFSNPAETENTVKGLQYVDYYKELAKLGVHSAYAFVSNASSGFPNEIWDNTPIPAIVGDRHDK